MEPALQRGIALLPQELQDEILFELLKIHLVRGRIQLDNHGRATKQQQSDQIFLPKPRASILTVLGRKRLSWARELLYSNTFAMPTGNIDDEFFRLWDLDTLRRLPRIELRIDIQDFKIDTWYLLPKRRIFRFRSARKSFANGNRLPLPKIWSYLSLTIDGALSDDWTISDVVYMEECETQVALERTLAPRESFHRDPHINAVDVPRSPRPLVQMVTLNREDVKGMLDALHPLFERSYPMDLPEIRREVEDKLHVVIRIVNRRAGSIPKFRALIQVEGIGHTEEERIELWAHGADKYDEEDDL